jgi:enoyl-CoA hydratase
MDWQRILYEQKDDIVKIIMNWPEKHNAQDYLMLEEMMEAFKQAESDENIRVIILAGAGRSFSSGHDMSSKGLPAKESKMMKGYVSPGGSVCLDKGAEEKLAVEDYIYYNQALTLRNVSKPTIAQVQGHCVAGGFYTACMMDIIVASDDAIFQNPVLRMASVGLELLCEPWEFGPRKAKEFLWTGDPMSAQEAWRLGMVNRVVPKEHLEDEVMKLAGRIACMPPVVVSLTKRSINHTLDLMGQSHAWEYHYILHHIGHNTKAATEVYRDAEVAQQKGTLKEFLARRDAPFEVEG